MGGATGGEAVDDAPRAAALEVVELAERALQVAVMVEGLESAEDTLAAAADEFGDLVRAKEAVPVDSTKNLRVTVGGGDGREFPSPAKPGMAYLHRHPILSRTVENRW